MREGKILLLRRRREKLSLEIIFLSGLNLQLTIKFEIWSGIYLVLEFDHLRGFVVFWIFQVPFLRRAS